MPCGKNLGRVDDFGAKLLDLLGGELDHLNAVLVVAHSAGQVGDLDKFVGVLEEHWRVFRHFCFVTCCNRANIHVNMILLRYFKSLL